jgi:uncharacterized protein DUF4956
MVPGSGRNATIYSREVRNDIPMSTENITPPKLILKLSAYFLLLIASIVLVMLLRPDVLRYLPIGGTDALQDTQFEITRSRLDFSSAPAAGKRAADPVTPGQVRFAMVFLATTLAGTVLIMLPITWTYSATQFTSGPRKGFVRALMVLPITASTVVLLIQDSLALAFGLAALVAAVRFRVSLSEAIDGIYVFAAISVGLAAGIGYLGVATVMALFFCLINAVLWLTDYGRNPLDEARRKAKRAKLTEPAL